MAETESRERRRFSRVRARAPVSSAAKIIVGAKAPLIDCKIVDLSAGGACLDVSEPDRLPQRFTLVHGRTRKNCLVKWRSPRRVGVLF